MKVLIVHAHPEPKSFCGSLFDESVKSLRLEGHEVQTADLYRMNFDPVSDRRNFTQENDPIYFKQQIEEMYAAETGGFSPDIEAEMQKVEWCDLMIWQFPLWWFGVPAILKGWVDRVFAMGRFYGHAQICETGVLKGRRAMLSLTTGAPFEWYQPEGTIGDINAILRPIQLGMLRFVGFNVLSPQISYGPAHKSDAER